jgi:crotonobetainyl-CoA:carnitine CoA-transferase CaiB-like acyl-CoA transferase
VGGVIPQRIGSGHPNIVPYGNSYPTADGREIVLAVGNDGQFQRLCTCLGVDEVARDPRFLHNAGRVFHRDELNQMLSNAILQFQRDSLLAKLHENQVPAGAVHDMQEACTTPQALDLRLQGSALSGMRTVALAGLEGIQLAEPPHLAEHTKSVLSEILGYNAGQIDLLILQKAIL